jgi:hypothetical protein
MEGKEGEREGAADPCVCFIVIAFLYLCWTVRREEEGQGGGRGGVGGNHLPINLEHCFFCTLNQHLGELKK